MKTAIITDTHYGARSDSQIFDSYFKRFYEEEFFPFIDAHDIKHVFHLGDVFDRRKYINFNILNSCKEYFFQPLFERGIHVDMLAGNHDEYYKNIPDVNSPELLLAQYPNIHIYTAPETIEVDGTQIAMLPWICSGNYKESMKFIEETPATILFGHLDIAGFEMHKGAPSDHGFDKALFKKFDIVATGHFHHKSTDGNIMYLGAPYEMTWADFDDPRGFHVFDTTSREFEYHRNPLTIFKKIYYDDSNTESQDLIITPEGLADNYIKIIVREKHNPYWFDIFVDKVNEQNPASVQIIEDALNIDSDDELLSECEDTLSLLKKFVEQADITADKKKLTNLMVQLYTEAQDLE